jgi:uncharacterized protein YdaU (DUF1376 family)
VKPDAYMPFYGSKFQQAVKGLPAHVALGYLWLLIYNWEHLHCAGLKDDKEYLRRIAEIDKADWQEFFETIFDNGQFFCLGADDLWHQKNQDEQWAKAMEKYEAVLDRAKKGAAAKWKNHNKKRKER